MTKTLAIGALAIAATGAQAILIIDPTPGKLLNTENVLFNSPGLILNGPIVQGALNKSEAVVNFYDAGEDLFADAMGQARIEAVDGSFNTLSVRMDDPGLGIAAYQFNVNALDDGDLTINLYEGSNLSLSESFSIDAAGANWFRIYGTKGEVLSRVTISSTSEIQSVGQNRIAAAPAPVPEPSSLVAIGLGLALLLRRRLR
jgi:hypothetical protein